MTDLDRLVVAAIDQPDDSGCRGALADALREWGDPLLAHAVEDAVTGPGLLQSAAETGKQCGLPTSANLLWCEFHVLPRLYGPPQTIPPQTIPPQTIPPQTIPLSDEEDEQIRREWEEHNRTAGRGRLMTLAPPTFGSWEEVWNAMRNRGETGEDRR